MSLLVKPVISRLLSLANINSSKIGSLHFSSGGICLYCTSLTKRGDNSLTSVPHKVAMPLKLFPYTILISFSYSLTMMIITFTRHYQPSPNPLEALGNQLVEAGCQHWTDMKFTANPVSSQPTMVRKFLCFLLTKS